MSDAVERIQRVRGVSDPKLEESPRVVEPGADILTLHSLPVGAPAPAGGRATRVAIRETGRTYFIPVASIDWIEGADYYVKLHVGGRVHLLREPLRSLAQRLDPARFARVHRSAIVNLSRIREIRMAARGDHTLVLEDTTRLRLTRARRRDLEALIELTP
ncbi:MAG TPA: LytTR family DNA-binding domain-containing protein [Gemmatimonadaceae bacterium]|nr:LytTR family DNA-binding domain-containing protein [Gemmatimonadaceae bacterium]